MEGGISTAQGLDQRRMYTQSKLQHLEALALLHGGVEGGGWQAQMLQERRHPPQAADGVHEDDGPPPVRRQQVIQSLIALGLRRGV